ncbi:MAG: hypothetical protein GX303_06075 [Clostridiales bacterium]|nr:hypothetical protein [Clostridiales bacterium]
MRNTRIKVAASVRARNQNAPTKTHTLKCGSHLRVQFGGGTCRWCG